MIFFSYLPPLSKNFFNGKEDMENLFDVDKWVKLLVLKGSNVRYTYNRVSVLNFFQGLKRFYTEDEDEYEYFIGDLDPEDVKKKMERKPRIYAAI